MDPLRSLLGQIWQRRVTPEDGLATIRETHLRGEEDEGGIIDYLLSLLNQVRDHEFDSVDAALGEVRECIGQTGRLVGQ